MFWLALRSTFGLGILSVAAFGFGAWITLLLSPAFLKFERVVFVLLGGFGLLSSIVFFAGQIRFTRSSISAILACGIILAVILFRRVFHHAVRLSTMNSVPKLPVSIVGFILLVTAISGLAEVTGDWNNDAVVYHLLGPKVWLRTQVIRPLPDDSLTAFPQISETLFAALWSVGGSRGRQISQVS